MTIFSDAAGGMADFLNRVQVALRAFQLGTALASNTDRAFGHDTAMFTPAEYGNYIATSNAVYTCATLRADLISSLPLRAWKKSKSDKVKPVEKPDSKALALLQYVNPFWSGNRLRRMTELALCLWGKNVWFVERGKSGTGPPQEIWWARPDRVRVVPDPVNYIKEFRYRPANGGEDLVFLPSETVWMPYPNPIDEFEGLSPIAAARLAAEYGTAAMQSNRNLFINGIQAGGLIMPKAGMSMSKETAETLEEDLARRFRGVDKAHRWGVLRAEAQLQPLGFSPKDAEFVKGQALALEDVCRAYHIPPDLVGGQRTYANVESAMVGVWEHCVIPEAHFITSELIEKYLPMFADEADDLRFDTGNISILTEARGRIITQMYQLWQMGTPLNKLLREFLPNLLPDDAEGYPWGDAAWLSATVVPIGKDGLPIKPEPVAPPAPAPEPAPPDTEKPAAKSSKSLNQRMVEYGSGEHERLWKRFAHRSDVAETTFAKATTELFKRQRDSVLARLKQRSRNLDDVVESPFDKAEWIKRFRVDIRDVLKVLIGDFGKSALDDLSLDMSFNVLDPNVLRFLESSAQRFAREVNDGTWNDLKAELAEGIDQGESLADIEARIRDTFASYVETDPEAPDALNRVAMIARTEVNRAANGGTLQAWNQSGEVELKSWLATLDSRTRDTHAEAHDRYQAQPIPLNEDFEVGGAHGLAPGQLDEAGEVVNCRCTMTAVLKERSLILSMNGHKELAHERL